MTEKEAMKIAQKAVAEDGFPFCKTIEKGTDYVFLFSGGKAIPDKIIVAVTNDGSVGYSIISAAQAKENARK